MQRVRLWREMFVRPMTAVIAFAFALLGALQTVREFLPRKVQENYTLSYLLPAWPWSVWAMLALTSVVSILATGAAATVRKRDEQIDSLRDEIARLSRTPAPRLVFEFGHLSAELIDDESTNPYQTHRVALTNRGNLAAQGVKVQLLHINPTPAMLRARFPLPLHPMHAPLGQEEFDLSPGETRPIDVFQFDYRDPSLCLTLPHVNGILDFAPHELLLEATARNAQRETTAAWIWVGEGSEIGLSNSRF